MAENSRIEDLRKRYHENPRRFFAPLANEYRKAGFLDRALLLCQKHVPEQPDNMNGLVVFGQTLFEAGNTAEAQEPFERALKVDPENLIALRHLGDIARIGGDVETAKSWYNRVLELDRRNDEVLDLLQQMGVSDAPVEPPSARPSMSASDLVSVAPSVSMSSGSGMGMIDLDMPAAPAAPAVKPATPAKTLVINAQALADRDRQEASGAAAITTPSAALAAAAPSIAEAPSARPSKRASLLDIDFDFSETAQVEEKPVIASAPLMGAEAAEYGFAIPSGTQTQAETNASASLGLETTALDSFGGETIAPESLALQHPPSSGALLIETTGDMAPLGLEPTIADAASAPEPALPAGDFELAEFNAQVSPLAGLEASEFTSETVAPLAELDNDTSSASLSAVPPLDGLDRPDVDVGSVEPLAGLADLPLLEDEEPISAALTEPPSARPKPRMTKADMSSIPLLADFGLEDDDNEPASSKLTPIITPAVQSSAEMASLDLPSIESPSAALRASKATPAFVTETMAALYVKQGHLGEAIGVYRQLVAQSPNDSGLRAKLGELERMQRSEVAEQASAASAAASSPAVDMPEFDVPLDAEDPAPAAANTAMQGLSFGGIGLQGQGSDPLVTPNAHSGPSAREFFGGFARRAAVAAAVVAATVIAEPNDSHAEPTTAVSATPSAWPLDSLFGAAHDVRDLHAAEVLAGVGSFTGPDGGTGFDTLFNPSAEPARRAVPRASEMLKFDQFFQAPGAAASGTAAPADDAPAGGGDDDDDLDQFHGWLQGLKK